MFNLNKYKANILEVYFRDENNNAKNSTTFPNYIRNVFIEDDEIIVSIDVTFLYKYIRIIDTLSIIKDYVNKNDEFTGKATIPQEKFLDLVKLVLKTTWYSFNSQFYQQTDGVAMGGKTSSSTAGIDMQDHKYILQIPTAVYPQKVWEQFLDDVYSVLKRTH